jgi:dipeptidyl aminopeptidase/acylaminoacyl peptidase
MRNFRYGILVCVIANLLVACSLINQNDDEQQNQVATSVAETLDALGLEEETPTVESTSSLPVTPATQEPVIEAPQRIVFTDNQNVWIGELGAIPRQLTFDGGVERVRISSDGMRIAFTRRSSAEENSELLGINPDGTGESLLLTRESFNSLYPSPAGTEGFDIGQMTMRPDTHLLFFNTLEVFEDIGYRNTNDLFMIDLDSGELTGILPAGAGGNFEFSPGGEKIAVIRPDSISVVNGDGSDYLPELFSHSPVLTYSEFQYYSQPVWSRDSSTIGVAIPSDDPLADDAFGEVWLIPSNGDPPISQGRISGDFYFSQVFSSPTLSPQLDRVAFTRPTDVPNQRDLFIANIDGSEEILFDSGAINWDGWAPDNLHMVYSVDDPMDLILAVDGGAPRLNLVGADLHWIGENRYLLVSGNPGNWTIVVGQIDGLGKIISNPTGDFLDFDFSD